MKIEECHENLYQCLLDINWHDHEAQRLVGLLHQFLNAYSSLLQDKPTSGLPFDITLNILSDDTVNMIVNYDRPTPKLRNVN